jgi:uncharacterized protein YjbK
MSESIEVESKFSLDASEFERVKSAAHVARCIEQCNVYYDWSWQLASLAATCRIRFVNGGAATLTVKLPVSEDAGARSMREFEYEVVDASAEEASEIDVERELPPDIGEILLFLGINRLERFGAMRNRRYLVEVNGIGTVELDEVSLPDGTKFYEAEVEEPNTLSRDRLVDWLRDAAPNAQPSYLSKFQRFRNAFVARAANDVAELIGADEGAS